MIKLSEINETSWGGMVRRSSSNVVRKQDEPDWINLGPEFDCLWLNGVYEKDEKNEFTYDEVKDIVSSIPGAELPSFEDLKKLKCTFIENEKYLYIEGSENHMDPIHGLWRVWNNKGGVCLLSLGAPKIRLAMNGDKYPFLLVKRKLNETSWGGMVRRSNPEKQVRKEDEVKMEYFPYTRLDLATILMNMRKNLTDSVLDARSIDVSRVEDFSNIFEDFDVKYIDVRGWNTSRCIDMDSVFSGCDKLEEIIGIEKWDVSNVKRMEDMFYDCEKLKTLNISNWNVENVKRALYMFGNCFELESLNLGNWKTSNLQNAYGMFSGCKKLEILDVSGWNVKNLESAENMFAGCEALKVLDVRNWRPVELINVDNMFAWCGSLEELDLSGWKLKYRIPVSGMFKGCPENVKWVFDKDHFYKAIEETSWGGMVRRSSSDVVRKENWLNGLGRREFYDHLKKTYDTRCGRVIVFSKDVESILVPLTGQRSPMYLHLDYENEKLVDIYYYSFNKSLAITLSDTFDVRYGNQNIIHITGPHGDLNNEVAIEVIDTISNIVTSPAIVKKNWEINETSTQLE